MVEIIEGPGLRAGEIPAGSFGKLPSMKRKWVVDAFVEIKRDYFPRWDAANAWQAEFAGHDKTRGNSGYCDSKAKRVFLDDHILDMLPDAIRGLLVHEICHDTGAAKHGVGWARRVEAAARQAEAKRDARLAAFLRNDLFSYCRYEVYVEVTGKTGDPEDPRNVVNDGISLGPR